MLHRVKQLLYFQLAMPYIKRGEVRGEKGLVGLDQGHAKGAANLAAPLAWKVYHQGR